MKFKFIKDRSLVSVCNPKSKMHHFSVDGIRYGHYQAFYHESLEWFSGRIYLEEDSYHEVVSFNEKELRYDMIQAYQKIVDLPIQV